MLAAATDEERRVAIQAYETWVEQFPKVASIRSFFVGTGPDGEPVMVPCGPEHVQSRFLGVARSFNLSAQEAYDVLKKDLWVLNEQAERIPVKADALRSVAQSDEEVLELLRLSPKILGMTSAAEMRERGMENMRFRVMCDLAYDALISPINLLFVAKRKWEAASMNSVTQGKDGAAYTAAVSGRLKEQSDSLSNLGNVFWGSIIVLMVCTSYLDYTYGGPIHGKGICPASPIPTFNIPDDEGNTRLPCNCAPIWKWYIEPKVSKSVRFDEQGEPRFQPSVDSKNCGRKMGGEKRECNPLTPGGCVWTAEDLEKDPSYWDSRAKTKYELLREAAAK